MYKFSKDFSIMKKLGDIIERYNNGEITLTELLSYYRIQVDESRLDDYVINSDDLDTENSSCFLVRVYDKGANISYKSYYTSDVPLKSYYGSVRKYINLNVNTPTYQVEKNYGVDEDIPIIEKLTFTKRDYSLNFIREYSKNTLGDITGLKFTVNYSGKKINKNNLVEWYTLFERDYSERFNGANKILGSSQSLYVPVDSKSDYRIDKNTYYNSDNVAYSVYDYVKYDKFTIRGVCLEKCGFDVKNCLPDNFLEDEELCNTLTDSKNSSAIMFSGYISDNGKYAHHRIEVYKRDCNAHIKYEFEDKAEKSLTIPLLNNGTITSDEIKIINLSLIEEFGDSEFINLMTAEFDDFGEKIDIRKGLIDEEIDELSPSQFSKMPLEDIAKLVDADRDKYFDFNNQYFNDINSNGGIQKQKKVV